MVNGDALMFVVSAWLIIKKLKPEWIGLSKDLNEQIIDGVKFEDCSQCESGLLEPIVNSKIKVHGIPVFYLYIKNENIELCCNRCAHKETRFVEYMRLSLVQKILKL